MARTLRQLVNEIDKCWWIHVKALGEGFLRFISAALAAGGKY